MKILVTGANGLLGQKLVARLRQQAGVELLATSRGPFKLAHRYPEVPFVPLDVADERQVLRVLAQAKPTHVLHAAALTQVDECELNQAECWRQNVTATQHLVAACAQLGIRLYHVSTDFVFSGETGLLAEDARPDPVNFYGHSKLAAEQAVQASAGAWAILRTVLVYGVAHQYGRSNLVTWVRDSLRAGQPIRVVDDQWRTPTLAEDLAEGCWLAMQHHATGLYHLSGPDLLTPYQMAQHVADAWSLPRHLITRVDAASFTQPARRPPRTGFVIEKARRELGFAPHSFAAGLAIVRQQLGD